MAALDAATRTVASLVRSAALDRGLHPGRVIERFLAHHETIPSEAWMVQPAPPSPDGEEQLWLKAAVLVRVRGRPRAAQGVAAPPPLSPEPAAPLDERPP